MYMNKLILSAVFTIALSIFSFGQDSTVLCPEQIKARQFETAVATCTEAAKTNPKIGNYGIGTAYMGMLDWKSAIRVFSAMIEAEPTFIDAIISRGSANYNAGNFKTAYDDFSKAVRVEPRIAPRIKLQMDASREIAELLPARKMSPDIVKRSLTASLEANDLLIGRSVKKMNNELQSTLDATDRQINEKLDEALRLNKYNAHAYSIRAKLFEIQARNAMALVEHTKAIAVDPLSGSTIFSRGLLYVKMKNYPFAIADFSKAIEIAYNAGSYTSVYYSTRAEAYEKAGQKEKALQDLTYMVEVRPKEAFGYGMRASFYLRQNEGAKALADLNKAIELDPKDASSLLNRCQYYINTRKFAAAVTDCSNAIGLKSYIFSDLALTDRATAYTGLKKYDLALADLAAAEKTGTGSKAEIFAQRGVIFATQNKKVEAKNAFEAALKEDPKNQKALEGLKSLK